MDTTVGELGNKIGNRHADFDVRNYGYSKLSKFLESFKSLKLKQKGKTIYVDIADTDVTRDEIAKLAIEIVAAASKKTMSLPELKQKIEKKIPNFNIRNYKYSKFSQFVNDMDGLIVNNNTVRCEEAGE